MFRLKNAEDTVAYKESCISKLKDEIRRMRSEDMSCELMGTS